MSENAANAGATPYGRGEAPLLHRSEAESLKQLIRKLRATDIGGAGQGMEPPLDPWQSLQWIARLAGLPRRRLPADQWFLLCARSIHAALPPGSAALERFQAIEREVEVDGRIVDDAVRLLRLQILALLQIAEETVELYVVAGEPEDIDLRVRDSIRRQLLRSRLVQVVAGLTLLFLLGGTYFGSTFVEGFNRQLADLKKELNGKIDTVGGEVNERVEQLRKTSQEMNQLVADSKDAFGKQQQDLIKLGNQAAEQVNGHISKVTADITDRQTRFANQIAAASQNIATLNVAVREDFERIINDKNDELTRRLEESSKSAEQTVIRLTEVGKTVEGLEAVAEGLSQSLESLGTAAAKLDQDVKALETQRQQVGETFDELFQLYSGQLAVALGTLDQGNRLYEQIGILKTNSETLYGELRGTKADFDEDLTALQEGLDITGERLSTYAQSAETLGSAFAQAREALGHRMLGFETTLADTTQRLTLVETEALPALETQLNTLGTRTTGATGRLDALIEQVDGYQKEFTDSRATIAATTLAATTLGNDLTEAKRIVRESDEGLKAQSTRLEDLEAELAKLKARSVGASANFERLETSVGSALERAETQLSEAGPLVIESQKHRLAIGKILTQSQIDQAEIARLKGVLAGRSEYLLKEWDGSDGSLRGRINEIRGELEDRYGEILSLMAQIDGDLAVLEGMLEASDTKPD